jgi:hypothetical protein
MKLIPKAQNQKKPKKEGQSSRARSREGSALNSEAEKSPEKSSIPQRIASSLANILTDDDLAEVVDVYRRGLRAKQRIWVENAFTDDRGRLRGRWEFVDDFRVQKACADMIAAYKEGLPVQRQAILVQKFETMDETRERIANSPELLKAIGNLSKSGIQVEACGQVIDVEMTVQKTGSQNQGVASEETDED